MAQPDKRLKTVTILGWSGMTNTEHYGSYKRLKYIDFKSAMYGHLTIEYFANAFNQPSAFPYFIKLLIVGEK